MTAAIPSATGQPPATGQPVPSTPLRVGLLGTGHWAATTHGPAVQAAPDAELVGVWGRSPDKASQVGEQLGVPAFADLDALLDVVDAVAVALPPDVQADLAVRAARAGCHLLLDKPLALDVAAADRVVAEVREHGLASVVFFTSRFQPPVEEWLREVTAAADWHGGQGAWLGSIYQPGSPYAGSVWRQERGALWDVGPHALSVTVPVLGPVEYVVAASGPGDTVQLALRHARGAASSIALSLTAPPAAAHNGLEVWGAAGWSAMPPGDRSAVEALTDAVAQLCAQVAGGAREHPCDVRFARDVVAVLAAAEEALATGRAVSPA